MTSSKNARRSWRLRIRAGSPSGRRRLEKNTGSGTRVGSAGRLPWIKAGEGETEQMLFGLPLKADAALRVYALTHVHPDRECRAPGAGGRRARARAAA